MLYYEGIRAAKRPGAAKLFVKKGKARRLPGAAARTGGHCGGHDHQPPPEAGRGRPGPHLDATPWHSMPPTRVMGVSRPRCEEAGCAGEIGLPPQGGEDLAQG